MIFRTALLLLAVLLSGCTATKPAAPAAELLDTYWRPAEIAGSAIVIRPGTREPHLLLSKEGSRASSYAGCNSFSGSYVLAGGALRFGPMAVTRRACLGDGADALESAFLQALGATTQQKITGESLELLDAAGKPRMKLIAHPLH